MLSISVHKNLDYSTPIMFVPLGIATTTQKKPVTPVKKITPPAKATIVKKTPVQTTVATVVPKKLDVKKDSPVKVKESPAPIVKKVEEVKKIAEVIQPKIEPIKKVAAVEKSTPVPVEKKPEPVAQAPSLAKTLKNTLDVEQTVVPQPPAQALESAPVIPENAHVSHNYREVEALRRGAQLQKELVHTWKPPIGVSPDCMCEISFFVSSSGKIENLKMIKNSGVLMYDLSARQALFAMKMPQWTHGKPLTISFKQ